MKPKSKPKVKSFVIDATIHDMFRNYCRRKGRKVNRTLELIVLEFLKDQQLT